MWQLRMHCNLRPLDVRASCSKLFLTNFVLRMRTNCYVALAASDQNSDIAIRFSVTDFLTESNNLAIR